MSTAVASKNPFELLGDDDGGAPAAAPAKPGANKAAEPKKAGGGDAAKKGGPASRSGRYPGRGGPPRTTPRAENVNEDASDAPKRFDGEKARRGGTRGRGGEGGRGGGRGYGGRGGGRGGPRADRPDRHSATGIVDSEKKLHQGWGGDTGDGEQLAEAQGEADAKAAVNDWSGGGGGGGADSSAWDTPAPGGDTPAATGDGAGGDDADAGGKKYRERRQREEEEDEGLQTLEEYRKTQTTGLEELVPKLEVRTANDGANDKSLFKGATKLVKDEEASNYFVGKGKSGPRVRAQKEAKQIIEIDGRFDRPNRGGEGRGRGGDFRGRGRGGGGEGRGGYENRGGSEGRGRGRGGPRGGGAGRPAQSPQEVNVEDTSAFPSLA